MTDVETKNTLHNLGELALPVFRGARESGASILEATLITYGWWRAMINQDTSQGNSDDA